MAGLVSGTSILFQNGEPAIFTRLISKVPAGTLLILKGAMIACIGPITAETAQKLGLAVDIVAADYTVDGLIEALLNDDPKISARNIK